VSKPAVSPKAASVPTPPVAGTEQEHEARGRAFIQSEKFPEALAELNQAIQLAPKASRAYNARGFVYLRQRDYQHALADFNDAIRLDPNYANAYKNRAVTRKLLGDMEGAAADLKAAK
jgi:Flp pilus assembly protein TadD